MGKTQFSILAVFGAALAGLAFGQWSDLENRYGKYLKSDNGAFYDDVLGDGYEAGLEISATDFAKDDDIGVMVEIPKGDNFAECVLEGTEVVKKEKTIADSEYSRVHYKINISTAVLGDTGGCLVWIKAKESSQTLKIVHYTYITDY